MIIIIIIMIMIIIIIIVIIIIWIMREIAIIFRAMKYSHFNASKPSQTFDGTVIVFYPYN